MRRRRQDALSALTKDEEYEAVIIVDTERDELLEDVGTAMDTLRMAGIVHDHELPVEVCTEFFRLALCCVVHRMATRESIEALPFRLRRIPQTRIVMVDVFPTKQ